jgi:hypothetical protein
MVDLQGKYLDIMRAISTETRSSQEIAEECRFPDTFQCSSAISILVRGGYILKGYHLTQKGADELRNRGLIRESVQERPDLPGLARVVTESRGSRIDPEELFR